MRMQSSSAHIAFHEIMPLQEFFEETAIFQITFQPGVIHQLLSRLALVPRSDAWGCCGGGLRRSDTHTHSCQEHVYITASIL